ncbi:MAG: CsbD family protein [bacterium]
MTDDLGTDGLKNQVKGSAKELGGKIQKNVGDMTDNESQEFKGATKELEGKAQRKVGEAETKIDRNI